MLSTAASIVKARFATQMVFVILESIGFAAAEASATSFALPALVFPQWINSLAPQLALFHPFQHPHA